MSLLTYDLTDAVRAIARRGGRFVTRYSTPAWYAELTTTAGEELSGSGPTASQAIEDLGRKLRKERD